jgi:hypothetical protein
MSLSVALVDIAADQLELEHHRKLRSATLYLVVPPSLKAWFKGLRQPHRIPELWALGVRPESTLSMNDVTVRYLEHGFATGVLFESYPAATAPLFSVPRDAAENRSADLHIQCRPALKEGLTAICLPPKYVSVNDVVIRYLERARRRPELLIPFIDEARRNQIRRPSPGRTPRSARAA